MRRSGAEKLEMIRLVEQSDLPVRLTLRQLGIAPSTFYGWYQRYLDGGPEEAYLEGKFGESYLSYKNSVRRWI